MGTLPGTWQEKTFPDITSVEWVAWSPLLVGILFLGIFPIVVLNVTNEAVNVLARVFGGG